MPDGLAQRYAAETTNKRATMSDSLTVARPRPPLSHNPLDVLQMARELHKHTHNERDRGSFATRLAQLVSQQYSRFPAAEAQRYADDALDTAYRDGPPPYSCTYRYIISLPIRKYSGWDRERCQRLCAAVCAAYRLHYPPESS